MGTSITDVDFSKIHSIRSAAKFCGVSPSAIRNWILTERLPVARVGNRYLIQETDLQKINDLREQDAQASAAN